MKDTNEYYRVGQITVNTTAIKINASKLADGNKRGILIKAYGENDTASNTAPIFVGNAQVTVTDGFPIGPGESVTFPITGDDLYAVVSAGTQKLAWAAI